jgi:glucose/arabinose dehydrogenase
MVKTYLNLRWASSIMIIAIILILMMMAAAVRSQSGDTFEIGGVQYRVEQVRVANYPVALAFASDGRLFYTEKTTGNVRLINANGELQSAPVITFPSSALAERGLIGITLDPDYSENGMIWVFHTAEGNARDYPANRIVRFHELDGIGSDPEVMLSVPIETGSLIHNGGNLRFDDDGLLYVSFGDYDLPANSQDLTTIPGKLHRYEVTEDGLVPAADNPVLADDGTEAQASIFAYGLRNPWDFDFDPESGFLFATENGDNCDDEINLILPGFNYGAGEGYVCGDAAPGIDRTRYLQGLLTFTPTEAPTGIVVYDHPAVPEWNGRVFFCAWNADIPLRMLTLNPQRTAVEQIDPLPMPDGVQCRIDLEIAPDGSLYFTTVGADGGAIYRIVPSV